MKQLRKFYLFGDNIQTSLSPLIHTSLFKMKNMSECSYFIAEPSSPPSLEQFYGDPEFGGVTLTIPFKSHFSGMLSNHGTIRYNGKFCKKTKVINTLIKTDGS